MRAIAQSRKASASPLDRESRQHGVDLDALRDLKAVFDSSATTTGEKKKVRGVSEAEFIRVFAPQLFPSMSEEEMRGMYRGIDADCSGSVTWTEISNFLVGYTPGSTGATSAAMSRAVDADSATDRLFAEPATEGRPAHHKSHSHVITHIRHIPSADALFTGSTDGVVRCWNPSTLRSAPVPVHCGNSWITGLIHVPFSNRLLILQSDRLAFLCNVGSAINSDEVDFAPTELYRAYGSLGPSVEKGERGGTAFYRHTPSRRSVPGEHPQPVQFPVTLLPEGTPRLMCGDHVQTMSAGESVALGFDDGRVDVLYLHQSDKPLKPTARYAPHNDMVTQLNVESHLESLLTSSTDGTVRLTSIEKGTLLQKYSAPLPASSRTPNRRRPILSFDYCRVHGDALGFGAGRVVQIWNAQSGVRQTVLTDLDSPLVCLCFNPTKPHLYVLTESKTVKVFDIRMWKALQVMQDSVPRYPEDTLSCLSWVDAHSMLLSGANELIGWTTSQAAERAEAGVASTPGQAAEEDTHIHPITDMFFAERSGVIFTVDSTRVIAWSLLRFTQLWSWRWHGLNGAVTSVDLEAGELKLLVGTDGGSVVWVNAARGSTTNELQHSLRGEIACVAHFDFVTPTSSCSLAACGLELMMWLDDARQCVTLEAPNLVARLPREHGSIAALCRSGTDGTVIMAACAAGSIVAVNALTMSVMFAFGTPSPDVSVDGLFRIMGGSFAAAFSNSNVRFFGFARETFAMPVMFFRAASTSSEQVTSAAPIHGKSLMLLGDSGGCVSVFRIARLLNASDMKQKLLPARESGACTESQATQSFVELQFCWVAHDRSPVSGVGYIASRKHVVTAGGDRRIRAWNLTADSAVLISEFGRDILSVPAADVTLVSHQFSQSFHPHGVPLPASELGASLMMMAAQGASLAASPSTSVFAHASGAFAEMSLKSAPTPAAVSSSLSLSRSPPMSPSSTASSVVVPPPKRRAATPDPGLALRNAAGAASTLHDPHFGSLVAETRPADRRVAMFELATRRTVQLRGGLRPEITPEVPIAAQLHEVAQLRERRMEGVQSSIGFFGALTLPSVGGLPGLTNRRATATRQGQR